MSGMEIMAGGMALGALGQGLAGYFGAESASETAAAAQREAARIGLQGMREDIAARERWGNQARADWAPFRQRGLSALDYYYQLATNPDMTGLRRERNDSIAELRAQLNSMGGLHSGWGQDQMSRTIGDWDARMFDRRINAMQPLLGLGAQAAGAQAQQAGQMGAGIGGAYSEGYGRAGQYGAQAGQMSAMGTSGMAGAVGNTLGSMGQAAGTYGLLNGLGPGQNPGGYPGGIGDLPPDWQRGAPTGGATFASGMGT
jgi:hypothetical protein